MWHRFLLCYHNPAQCFEVHPCIQGSPFPRILSHVVPEVRKSQEVLMLLSASSLKACLAGVLSPSRTSLLSRIKLWSPREWLSGDQFLQEGLWESLPFVNS